MARFVSLAEYKMGQERIGARAAARALSAVRPLVGERLTRSDIRSFASQIIPEIRSQRVESAALAREFYLSQREQYLGEVPELEAPKESYTLGNLIVGLSWFMKPGVEFHSDVEAASTAARHAKSGGRRESAGLSLVDARSEGWARTSGGTTSCSFCLMLISRGPVYRSRASAGGMKEFHNRCDCVVVPVFNKQSFPGFEEWKSASRLWNTSTKGKSGPAALKAFRNAITSDAPGGLDAIAA